MKKTLTALSVIMAFLIAIFILPPFFKRISYEKNHRIFTIAFDVADNLESLDLYKSSGAGVGVIKEKGCAFDENELTLTKKAGLTPALMIFPEGEKTNDYAKTLSETVKEYGVKYLILKDNKNENTCLYTEDICNIIKENNLTIVLSENISQLANEEPDGFESFIDSSGMKIMRSYETLTKSYSSNPEYTSIYYQMLNSAIDRNCEFLLLNQLNGDNGTRTAKNIEKLRERMLSLGYSEGATPNLSGYKKSTIVFGAIAAVCVIMLFIMYVLLTGKKIAPVFYFLILAAFGISFILPESLLSLYPTAFSALAPCFCFVICKNAKKPFLCIVYALIALLLSNMCLSSLLSGAEYYMNFLIFRGVIVTLIVPVLFAGMLYFAEHRPSLKSISKKHIAFAVVLLIVCAIYLLRSGNTQISEFERLLRDKTVDIFAARPRTKEFLVAWPCLMLFALRGKKGGILKFVSYVGAALLFASVTNSFCHVFCDAAIIYMRTLNGFIVSLPILLVIYFIYKKTEKSA